jgi:hypothetical protein
VFLSQTTVEHAVAFFGVAGRRYSHSPYQGSARRASGTRRVCGSEHPGLPI